MASSSYSFILFRKIEPGEFSKEFMSGILSVNIQFSLIVTPLVFQGKGLEGSMGGKDESIWFPTFFGQNDIYDSSNQMILALFED